MSDARETEPDEPRSGDIAGPGGGLVADEARTEFPLDDWSVEDRALLDRLLTGEDIAHVWQGATVVVPAGSQYVVDELIDQVEMSDTPGVPADVGEPGAVLVAEQDWDDEADEDWDDGIDAQEVLGTAFIASDRLARRASDPEGVRALVRIHEVMTSMALPFGFDPAVWADVVERAGVIAAALTAVDDRDQPSGEQLEELAEDLRARLRPLV